MFNSNPPYAIWSIWKHLPIPQKLLFQALCVLGLYSIFSAVVIMRRLSAMGRLPQREDAVAALRKRCINQQQFTRAMFYLFGLVLFVGFQWAYFTVDKSSTPIGWLILENLVVYFAFAANVFFCFFLIHCIQWFVSGRVESCASQLNKQQ
jgi:hypothetical protein